MKVYKLFSILFLIVVFQSCKQPQTLQGYALGTTYSVQYSDYSSSDEVLNGVEDAFYVLNKSLSTYLPNSDISKINAGDSTIVVDQHFVNVFLKSKEVWSNSSGFFDPTVGALANAYGFGPEEPLQTISKAHLDSLLLITGFDKVHLSRKNTIEKQHPSIQLDFNAIAKGYAVDVVGQLMDSLGYQDYLIEIGGELLAKGKHPKKELPWTVGIQDPSQSERLQPLKTVQLYNEALATSGNYRKYRLDSLTGQKFVHTINPKTGLARTSNILSASVIAPDCMTADAYATALMAMPNELASKMLQNNPTLKTYRILAVNDTIQSISIGIY